MLVERMRYFSGAAGEIEIVLLSQPSAVVCHNYCRYPHVVEFTLSGKYIIHQLSPPPSFLSIVMFLICMSPKTDGVFLLNYKETVCQCVCLLA
jgi:hypothetical protein